MLVAMIFTVSSGFVAKKEHCISKFRIDFGDTNKLETQQNLYVKDPDFLSQIFHDT